MSRHEYYVKISRTGGCEMSNARMGGWDELKTPRTEGCEMSNARMGGREKIKKKRQELEVKKCKMQEWEDGKS
jgi:hypothetical protein